MEAKRYPIRKLMLKAAVFASKSSLSPQVRELLAYSEIVELGRCLDYYPSEEEAMRFLQAHAPSIVFVDFESVESALALIAVIERTNPGTQIIALHRVGYDSDVLVKAMRAGVREVLAFPLSESTLADSLTRVAEILKQRPLSILSTDNLYCFLPAKPGLGASTLAVNASANLARISGQKTLLMDLDLNNGISSFLLKLENSNSIADALDHASELDGSLWTNLITTKGNLDILGSGTLRTGEVRQEQLLQILGYVKRCYSTVCVDLSGSMEPFTVDLLLDAKQIFLVCTQDILGLRLARAKAEVLRNMNLGDRTSILLNRVEKRSVFSIQEIEKLVGFRVRFSFANDDRRIQDAVTEGTHVDPGSELGKQYEALARYMNSSGNPQMPKQTNQRKFVEYFAITPQSFSFTPRKSE
jgi:pilus assembly protein CpaE